MGAIIMAKRQEAVVGSGTSNVYWLDSPKGYIVKGIIIIGLLVIFFLWFFIGYWHAKRRIERGLPLLWYHRFLIPKAQRYRTPQNNPNVYQNQRNNAMQEYPEPPPVYSTADMPPTYQPSGGNKAAVQQQQQQQQQRGSSVSVREASEV